MGCSDVSSVPFSDDVTPDGSPVAVYLQLAAHGEDAIIDAAIPAGATILELGCGVGRITHALVARGRHVVAVDESPAMIRYVREATTVCTPIEELALDQRFGGVVLASRLVNVADDSRRQLWLEVCARHVEHDGVVVIERWTPEQAASLRVDDPRSIDGVEICARNIRRLGSRYEVTLAYRIDAREWTQTFESEVLDDLNFLRALQHAGMRHEKWLDPARAWCAARKDSFHSNA